MITETNPLTDGHAYHSSLTITETVTLSDPRLKEITRLRLVGYSRDYPRWDVSYVHGKLRDGSDVRVDLGTATLSKWVQRDLVNLCRELGVYGKALNIFNAISLLYG